MTLNLKRIVPVVLSTLLISIPASAAESAIQAAVDHPSRSDVNKTRDRYRNPVETLSFFGVTPSSHVVEISPGGGWYTEILAPLLREDGQLYAAHFPASSSSDYAQRTLQAFKAKMAADEVYSNVKLTEFAAADGVEIAPANSADVVLTFRNLHNWYNQGQEAAMLTAFHHFYTALKPGGVLGVVEHRLPEDRLQTDWQASGYFPQSLAVELAERVGFELVATSEINSNHQDSADYPRGVWTLPPSLRLGEQDRDRYLAIGESDRMTLKFRKPQQ